MGSFNEGASYYNISWNRATILFGWLNTLK